MLLLAAIGRATEKLIAALLLRFAQQQSSKEEQAMEHEIGETPERRAARLAREAQRRTQDAAPPLLAVRDPLPLCIYTTVALLAWLFSPPLVVAWFAALGLRAYWNAWRAGLRRSNCILRDPRLVMAYLGLLGLAGIAATVWRILG